MGKFQRQETCQRGHNNWHVKSNGERRCNDCKNLAQRLQRGGSPPGVSWSSPKSDKSDIDMTFTLSDILRARGYE